MDPHVIERLSPYMDGELSPAERAQVDAHLRGCAACAGHLEELRAVEAAARALPLQVPPGYFESFPGRVRDRVAAARRQQERRRLIVPAWIGAAAAAVVLAMITPRLLREPPADVAPPAAASRVAEIPIPAAPAVPAPLEAPPATADQRVAQGAASTHARPAPPPPAKPAAKADNGQRQGFAERDELQSAHEQLMDSEKVATPPAAAAPATVPPAAANDYAAPPPKLEAESGTTVAGAAAPAEEAKKERRDKDAFALRRRTQPPPESDERFKGLLAKKPFTTAPEARAARDAWRAFVREDPAGPRADEARVWAIEAGAEAWRLGGDERDRADAERGAREYLARKDARQQERVRAVLRTLSP